MGITAGGGGPGHPWYFTGPRKAPNNSGNITKFQDVTYAVDENRDAKNVYNVIFVCFS